MDAPERSVTEWAKFTSELSYDDLPDDVVHRMKRSLLDVLGVGIIGSRVDTCRILLSYLESQGGTAQATVFPDRFRTTSSNAALAMGTFVHAPELAESFTRATMHVGNAVPPAALAEAEKEGASGRDLLTAMAIGYEIAIRSGLSVRVDPDSDTLAAKDETRHGGEVTTRFHPVPTFGMYGAAAAASHLLHLDAEKTAHALTLCSATLPAIGLLISYQDGAMAKDLYQGVANATGVMAAELAGLGVTGPSDVDGHLAALVPDYAPELLTRGLGNEWFISSGGLHFKWHQTAGMTQSAADAILAVVEQTHVDAAEVEKVEVLVNHRGARMCSDQEPGSQTAATLSIPYVASAILSYPDDVANDPHFTELYTSEKFNDPGRQDLARRVEVIGTEEFEVGFEREWPMKFPARATVILRSGEKLEGEAEIWSVTSNLSDDKVIAKFRDVAGRVLPAAKLDRTVEHVFDIDRHESIDRLIESVCH